MAVKFQCDGGCGFSTDDEADLQTVGFIKKRQFCADCMDLIGEMAGKIDAAHDKAAKIIVEAREKAEKTLLKRGFSLPDMPVDPA